MVRKFPYFLIACCFIALSFYSETESKTHWYKSAFGQGYISIETTKDDDGNTVINTTVNANFENEILDFTLSTTCDSDKMVSAKQLVFDGTMDSNMAPVNFTGKRVKSNKKANFWSFEGDFKHQVSPDPEVKEFIPAKHKSMIRIPERTIPSFNLLAIVPNLKLDRQGTFKFNSLDETKLYVKKKQTINYIGKSKESVDGEDLDLHKFVHQGKGMKPAYYWVNDNKELVKILLDGKFAFTLSEKEAILQNNVADGNED